jgi:hypothetical protein
VQPLTFRCSSTKAAKIKIDTASGKYMERERVNWCIGCRLSVDKFTDNRQPATINPTYAEVSKGFSTKAIAELIECEFVGDKDFPVHGMNEIHVVEPGDIVLWTIPNITIRLCNRPRP